MVCIQDIVFIYIYIYTQADTDTAVLQPLSCDTDAGTCCSKTLLSQSHHPFATSHWELPALGHQLANCCSCWVLAQAEQLQHALRSVNEFEHFRTPIHVPTLPSQYC